MATGWNVLGLTQKKVTTSVTKTTKGLAKFSTKIQTNMSNFGKISIQNYKP